MPTTLRFQGKSFRLNPNAAVEYIVMRLENVDNNYRIPLYEVMHGLQRAVVKKPAMHIKDQTIFVVPMLYSMTHRHPGVLSAPSLSPRSAFFVASSSSTTS